MDQYIYIICLTVGFVFTFGSLVFGHLLGGGHDVGHLDGGHVEGGGGHAEAGLESSDMPGMSPFSPMIIASFVAAFGGFGLIFREIPATHSTWWSAPLAMLAALVLALILFYLLRGLFRAAQSTSESRISEVVGVIAEVITPIPAKGVGEIAYVQKGARYSAPAREEAGEAVAGGQAVKIVRVAGSQFYVSTV